MRRVLAALSAGALFGAGLAFARMTDPTVVLAFLDVTGPWNASLALVMAAAALVFAVAYRLVLARGRPVFAEDFQLPTAQAIDGPLLLGAALFGVGWGMAGYCPGPALVALAGGVDSARVFVPAMIAGALLQRMPGLSASRR